MAIDALAKAGLYKASDNIAGAAKPMERAADADTMDTAVVIKPAAVEKESKSTADSDHAGSQALTDKQEELNQEKIRKRVETINKQLSNTECQYGFHEKTNRVIIKIVDKDSNKVIREFPPEETLEMIAKAWELAGIMVDEKL